jgi:transcriptional regulator with XRE-family HTH domain
MSVGDRLEKIRANKGISQKDFAEFLDIPLSTYTNYSRNITSPKIDILYKLLDDNYDIHWLLTGTGSMIRDNQAVNPPLVFSEELLQAVIIRVEQVFNDAGKVTSPEKKAQVIVTLYALLAEQAESGEPVKVPDPGTILRLVRLAG